jgi:hypothetical protein
VSYNARWVAIRRPGLGREVFDTNIVQLCSCHVRNAQSLGQEWCRALLQVDVRHGNQTIHTSVHAIKQPLSIVSHEYCPVVPLSRLSYCPFSAILTTNVGSLGGCKATRTPFQLDGGTRREPRGCRPITGTIGRPARGNPLAAPGSSALLLSSTYHYSVPRIKW